MQKIDNIIEQINRGIKRQEMLIARENPETEKGRREIEYYRCKIAELEYRLKELEEKKKGNSAILKPKYGDGKYATEPYREAFDMLRVCYYDYFRQDPSFSPVPKWNMMFYDSTLWMPVNTFLVKGKVPFQIMFDSTYPSYESDDTKSVSVEFPFEILTKEEHEEYLRFLLKLIKVYSGDGVNLVQGNGVSTRGMLSFIAKRNLAAWSQGEVAYYDFFDRLCDNSVRNIIYIGDSMKEGVAPETIDKVQTEIIALHKRLTAGDAMSEEELEQSNEKIKRHILTIKSTL